MTQFAPIAGEPLALAADLQLVLAPNPSPMTYLGTNTYILGRETLAIIDPGPDDPAHLAALTAAIAGRRVSHVLLTHSHLDHSPLAAKLDAPTYAFGDSRAGRSTVMQQLADDGLAGGGEGIDHAFAPDHVVKDGEVLTGPWGDITAIHTPGHIGNHLCFSWQDAIFTGDHVMGWASSLVSPPDGDLGDFMASCTKLQRHDAHIYYPGHGAPVTDPAARMTWLIAHRKTRETQIIAALENAPSTPAKMTQTVYQDLPPGLRKAAERNVFAHLVDLHTRGIVRASPQLGTDATFTIIG